MSIHTASTRTLEALHLSKAAVAQQALYASAKISALSAGEKRDEARRTLLPGLLQAVPDPRNPQVTDLSKAPYGTCQFFVPQDNEVYYVASDIHGDLESFVSCADKAVSECEKGGIFQGKIPVLIILGDLIDRGPNSAECIAFFLRLALGKDDKRTGLRVLLVRGDHDIALSCLPDGRITASVSPAEFAESFAEDESSERLFSPDAALARAFVRFVQLCCPSSALFSNGILMAHGAVPHSDLQSRLGMDLTLWSLPCAQDFSWCRLRTDKPSKAPNRYSKTSEMGINNFSGFIERLNELSMFSSKSGFPFSLAPVSVFLNGHEHCEGGYRRCSIPLTSGVCVVHNVSSFTERNLAEEVTTPSYLLRVEGTQVVPIPMAQLGDRWHDGIHEEYQTLVNEIAPDGDGIQMRASEAKIPECESGEARCKEKEAQPLECAKEGEGPNETSEQMTSSEELHNIAPDANSDDVSSAKSDEEVKPRGFLGSLFKHP